MLRLNIQPDNHKIDHGFSDDDDLECYWGENGGIYKEISRSQRRCVKVTRCMWQGGSTRVRNNVKADTDAHAHHVVRHQTQLTCCPQPQAAHLVINTAF